MTEDQFLMENELGDRVKVARILDGALGLPDRPWRNWDDWPRLKARAASSKCRDTLRLSLGT
jgi:hypothetical protein